MPTGTPLSSYLYTTAVFAFPSGALTIRLPFRLRGGADFISANYIKRAQDTLYLQKFNVNPKGTPNAYAPYTHQYMQ